MILHVTKTLDLVYIATNLLSTNETIIKHSQPLNLLNEEFVQQSRPSSKAINSLFDPRER